MKKGEPKVGKKIDRPRLFASSAIRVLPSLEIENSKHQGERAAVVSA
jgi:hypothetical protein